MTAAPTKSRFEPERPAIRLVTASNFLELVYAVSAVGSLEIYSANFTVCRRNKLEALISDVIGVCWARPEEALPAPGIPYVYRPMRSVRTTDGKSSCREWHPFDGVSELEKVADQLKADDYLSVRMWGVERLSSMSRAANVIERIDEKRLNILVENGLAEAILYTFVIKPPVCSDVSKPVTGAAKPDTRVKRLHVVPDE